LFKLNELAAGNLGEAGRETPRLWSLAIGVDQDMPFATFDLLARVVARRSSFLGTLCVLG
jgi:hypothetical protein